MRSAIRHGALPVLALALGSAAHAETTGCTEIDSIPYRITTPGIYCLKRSFTGNGRLIEINSDDVTVDLNGHVLVLDLVTAIGVSASNRSNVTVRNGTIRGGGTAVSLFGNAPSNNLVEKMRVEGAADIGISMNGRGSTVRDNVLIGVGSPQGPGARYGISVSGGAGTWVSGNQILDMTGPYEVDAIRIWDAPGAVIENNLITNTAPPAPELPSGPTGILVAAFSTQNMKTTVTGNRINNMRVGIQHTAQPKGGVSLFLNNTVGNTSLPFYGGLMPTGSNTTF